MTRQLYGKASMGFGCNCNLGIESCSQNRRKKISIRFSNANATLYLIYISKNCMSATTK